MRLSLAVAFGSMLVLGTVAQARSPEEILNSPEFKDATQPGLEFDIANATYLNCLAALADGGSIDDMEALARRVHNGCPDEAHAYLQARARLAAPGGAASDEDPAEVRRAAEAFGAMMGVLHQRLKGEAEIRQFEALTRKRGLAGIALGQCLQNAALKADDHVSPASLIAAKIAGACQREEQRELETMVEDQTPAEAAEYRKKRAEERMRSITRAVEFARENPHYYD